MDGPFNPQQPPEDYLQQLKDDPDLTARLHAALEYQLFTTETYLKNFEVAENGMPPLTPREESVLVHPAFQHLLMRHTAGAVINALSTYIGMTRRQMQDMPPVPPELLAKYSFFEEGEH